MLEISTFGLLALLNYGEVVSGQPTYTQRTLHTYTNLVRVDPMAWQDDYSCNTNSWAQSERTAKDPLYYHPGLNEIAQLHTEDMESGGFLSHYSSNGTSFSTRVWPYYEGNTISENVASGYSTIWAALTVGWMCSSGHRSNIMGPDFEDMGTGVEGTYYTQDLGGGANTGPYPVAMGTHTPRTPSSTVTFYTTWNASQPPALLAVETPDDCVEMSEFAGEDNRTAWSLEASAGSGCTPYRFFYETSGGTTGSLPSNGSYQYGQNCEAWVSEVSGQCAPDTTVDDTGEGGTTGDTGAVQWERPPRVDDSDPAGCACAAGGRPAQAWMFALLGLPLARRRRRLPV